MSVYLVDTNVIVDVLSGDPKWSGWSTEVLEQCANDGAIAVNPIIWAEVAAGFERVEALEAALPEPDWLRLPLPWAAGFLAGRVFGQYRKRGGVRPTPLPDFYIGAHAATDGLTLVTRDAARYHRYFPRLALLCPPRAHRRA